MNFRQRFCSILFAAICALALSPTSVAHAGGVHSISITSLPMARSPITIDGNLSDWPDVRPVEYVPIAPGLAKSGSPALDALRRHPDFADIQACYSGKALFIGIVWTGLSKNEAGQFMQLHIVSDRTVTIRIPESGVAGSEPVEEMASGGDVWHNISANGGAVSKTAFDPDGTVTQEIRIPWAYLTSSGVPSSMLTMAFDLEWPNLTEPFIGRLPQEVLNPNTHLTACFLTSPGKILGGDVYLGDPADWGVLRFVQSAEANDTKYSVMATGATETTVPKLTAPIDING